MDSPTLWTYVGMLLNLERDCRGIAATDLAARTGIDLPLVQRTLNGEPVDITVVRTMALALGWAWSDLLRKLAELTSPRPRFQPAPKSRHKLPATSTTTSAQTWIRE